MILQTLGLSKSFGSLAALVDVDMTVEQGEILGIAGPNGAGKSTLFNVIAGESPASAGKVLFDGHDITGLKAHRACRLGLGRTFQTPNTFPTLSVYDNLRVGATFGGGGSAGIRKNRIEETLKFLGLTPFRDSPASNLDLYSTKLVMLGAALATECKLLMLDEPLGGLSLTEMNHFLETVGQINQERGITIIIIEHILDSLIEVSNRMVILHNGMVIYEGDPGGVREAGEVVDVYLGKEEVG